MRQHGRERADDEWDRIRDIVEYVRDIRDDPDAGLWEGRGGNAHVVFSKVMCWTALDRGIDIATDAAHDAPLEAWCEARERIRDDVLERGSDEDTGAFVQAYGSETLDATGLLLPIVGFLPFDDSLRRNTVRHRRPSSRATARADRGEHGSALTAPAVRLPLIVNQVILTASGEREIGNGVLATVRGERTRDCAHNPRRRLLKRYGNWHLSRHNDSPIYSFKSAHRLVW